MSKNKSDWKDYNWAKDKKTDISPEWKEYRLAKENGKYSEYAEIDLKDWVDIPTTPYAMSKEDFASIFMCNVEDEYNIKQMIMKTEGFTEEQYNERMEVGLDRLYQEYLDGMTKP
jgi:hypothetical protein